MITWKFYSARKGISLESYLEGVSTYEDALSMFKERQIEPPSDLKNFYLQSKTLKESTSLSEPEDIKEPEARAKPDVKTDKKTSPARKSTTRTTKKTTTRRTARKTKSQAATKSKETKDPEVKTDEKKPYFRKIIKPEKK
jgi:hypothetical protein